MIFFTDCETVSFSSVCVSFIVLRWGDNL